MIFNKPRRMPYALQLLFFGIGIFISITLFAQVRPLFYSVLNSSDEFVFYGAPSYIAEKEWTVGRLLPWVDSRARLRFNLHGDDSAYFYLYLPQEELVNLSYWFPMNMQSDGSVSVTHSEIHCVRISKSEWVISEMVSSHGKISADTLYAYHLRTLIMSLFWCLGFLGLSVFFLCSLLRSIRWR